MDFAKFILPFRNSAPVTPGSGFQSGDESVLKDSEVVARIYYKITLSNERKVSPTIKSILTYLDTMVRAYPFSVGPILLSGV